MNLRFTHHRIINVSTWIVFVYVLIVAIIDVPRFAGDSIAMTQSAQSLINCARQGQFLGCPGANQYGVLQNIPTLFMIWKGMSLEGSVTVLGFLNVAAFILLVTICWRSFEGRFRNLALMVIFAGPLVGYVSSTFGEMLQTLVFVGFGLALVYRRPGWTLICGVLAAGTRETAFIPLALIAIGIAIFHGSEIERACRKTLVLSFAAISTGVLSITAFNYWKFGTWKNLGNLNKMYVTPGLSRKADSFVAIWFSPGGGVAPFWLFGSLASLLVIFFVVVRDRGRDRRIALMLGAGLGFNTATLAMWFAPFGWVAWGPRLMIPLVALVSLVCLKVFDTLIKDALHNLRWRTSFSLFIGVSCATSAAASIGYMRDPVVMDSFFVPDKVCNKIAIIQEDRPFYFMCLHHGAWKLDPSLWGVGLRGLDLGSWAIVLLIGASIAMALKSLDIGIDPQVKDQNLV